MEIINYWRSSRHIKPKGIQLREECKLFKSLKFNCLQRNKIQIKDKPFDGKGQSR